MNAIPNTEEQLDPPRIAVVGAGVAGAACARGLLRAGFDVTVFDKSRGVGGRMATRRVPLPMPDAPARSAWFDHGCAQFVASRPRFQAVVERAVALDCAARWQQRVHAPFPAPQVREVVVPTPNMPSFCRHLLNGLPVRLGRTVTGLQRCDEGWLLHLADDTVADRTEGPFQQVVLAIPAEQAAMLLRGHQTEWADALSAVRMAPCWTLMAVTDAVDWPWDAAELPRGALASISRNDRAPGRAQSGLVPWVAHATPEWSVAHLEDDPALVTEVLRAALDRLLGSARPLRWHHAAVHRWRYARLVQRAPGELDGWWSEALGLGVCGDAFGDGSVEGAWCSGDELADAIAAAFDSAVSVSAPTPELVASPH